MSLKSERTQAAVGKRLELVRRAYNLKQKDFCESVNMSESHYSQTKKGLNYPGLAVAQALKDVYGLTLDYIYDGDPSGVRHKLAVAIAALQEQDEEQTLFSAPRKPAKRDAQESGAKRKS